MSNIKPAVRDEPRALGDGRMIGNLIENLANKHTQLDISFHRTSIRLPLVQEGIELTGSVTIAFHVRDLSEQEREDLAKKNPSLMIKE